LFLAIAALISAAALATTPTLLVQQIVQYEAGKPRGLRDPAFLAFFTPSMQRAIRRDSAGNEVRVLDYDPLCQCQDNDGVRLWIVSIRRKGSTATAQLELVDRGERLTFRLILERIAGEWKVADVSTAQTPSLAAELRHR